MTRTIPLTRTMRAALAIVAACAAAGTMVRAQRGGGEWTTSGFDAQRTAWVRTDTRLTKKAVEKGEFQFLWKARFENESRQLNSLTEPVLQDLLIGYMGFKTLAFIGGSADRVFAIDTDLAKPYWTVQLNYGVSTGGQPPSSWECPGGLMATPSRRTALAPSNFGGGFGGGGRRMTSAVGEPGKGAAILATMPPRPATPVAAPASAAAAPAAAAPPRTGDAAAPAPRPSPVGPVSFGGVDPLFTMGSDGLLRTLRVSDGAEILPPVTFLPPSAKPSSLIFVDGVVYTTTSNGCGTAPNAVWAVDLASQDKQKKVVSWKTGGANVLGSAGLTFGTDGTLYVAVGNAPSNPPSNAPSNAVVALDRRELTIKDWFTTDGAMLTTSPIVIRYKDKDLIAAASSDGTLYLLDSASLGGADHKTPLFASAAGAAAASALATWDDGTTRWLLASSTTPRGGIVSFKLADAGGKPSLTPGWQSRELVSPLAPIVVNGLVMAASSGEYLGADASSAAARAQKSTPAVLYVLDATTGKELWSSGSTITSFARAGLSAGGGQVYLVTYDNHVYAFGIPMEH